MRVEPLSILELFDPNRQLVVPFFQRPYVWTQVDQWDLLWQDIVRVIEDNDSDHPQHFLGAIILNPIPKQGRSLKKFEIVDGQQRLLTLQVLLAAARDVAEDENFFKARGQLEELVQNSTNHVREKKDNLKLMPAEPDLADFENVILHPPPERSENKGTNLVDCYSYFVNQITKYIPDEPADLREQKGDTLFEGIQDYLKVVLMELGTEDDPQIIFESLNARSQPLTAADLIKNFLVYRVSPHPAEIAILSKESDSVWKMFLEEYWRETQSLGQRSHQNIDIYLYHFLSLQTKREAQMIHLFRDFKKWFEDSGLIPDAALDDIQRYGLTYRFIDEGYIPHSHDGKFFAKMKHVDLKTIYPLLMLIFGPEYEYLPPSIRYRCVDMLESVVIRRGLLRRKNKDYLKYFCWLIANIEPDQPLDDELKRLLLSSEYDADTQWPLDFEVRDQLHHQHPSVRFSEVTLARIAEHLDRNALPGSFSKWRIDYLMPIKWSEHQDVWPIGPSQEEFERRERLKRTIGNMTIVPKKLPTAAAQLPWSERRRLLVDQENTVLNQQLPFHLDEDAIEARSKEIAELVIEIWPRPTDEEPGPPFGIGPSN